jgi:nitrite reductase/ring-hydroxylating ferredoxin subunit
MLRRKLIGPITVVAVLTTAGGVYAAESARCPHLEGRMGALYTAGLCGFAVRSSHAWGQQSFDQTKPWGRNMTY